MSNDRRPRRRQQRQRRAQHVGYEPAGPVQFTGVMGFFQRNTRAFFLVGILVMVLSLGGFVFASQFTPSGTRDAPPTPTVAPASETPGATATGTPDPYAGIVRRYDAPPAMAIDPSKRYEAVIRLASGDVRIQLLAKEAPAYVNNFVFLAENRFYDGLTFHRVVEGFVAQGGDPTGTGFGDAGYALPPESNPLPFEAGVVSMAKAGTRVNGSQFFVTLGPAPHLNGEFTVFGRVVEGLDVLQSLPPRDPADTGVQPGAQILSIEVVEGAGS